MASSILRLFPCKWDVGSLNCTAVPGNSNRVSLNILGGRVARIYTTRLISASANCISPATVLSSNVFGVSDEESVPLNSASSIASPWLMLPPGVDAYNFYSLSENTVVCIKKKRSSAESPSPDDDAKLVGSSHGWLALFNSSTNGDIFLSNPLTGRHIKLPTAAPFVSKLCYPGDGTYYDSQWVTRVVISGSPEEQNCRAMMTYTPEYRLAFCCPARSFEWKPIGDLYLKFEEDHTYAREYEDFVYSRKHKLFFCVTTYGDFEAWDLHDPESPTMTPMVLSSDRNNYPWAGRSVEEKNLKKSCESKKSLVVAEPSGDLFHVRRFVKDIMCLYLYEYDSDRDYDGSVPYKTVSFDVHKIDLEKGELRYMDGSLDGLAMFVGSNHSFAVRASEYPGLKPDCIYFTDVFSPPYWDDGTYGGHDIGVFDYENGIISPCYYPIDSESIKRIVPSPIWFTPTQL